MPVLSNHYTSRRQMSESLVTAAFLSVSGGLQDAYTYISRGKVFANAQTGNIVLLSPVSYTHLAILKSVFTGRRQLLRKLSMHLSLLSSLEKLLPIPPRRTSK